MPTLIQSTVPSSWTLANGINRDCTDSNEVNGVSLSDECVDDVTILCSCRRCPSSCYSNDPDDSDDDISPKRWSRNDMSSSISSSADKLPVISECSNSVPTEKSCRWSLSFNYRL